MQCKVLAGLCTVNVWSLGELSKHPFSGPASRLCSTRDEERVPGTWPCPMPALSYMGSGVVLPSSRNLAFPTTTSLSSWTTLLCPPHLHSLISLLLKDLIYAPR